MNFKLERPQQKNTPMRYAIKNRNKIKKKNPENIKRTLKIGK